MTGMASYKKTVLAISLLIVCVFLLTKCIDRQNEDRQDAENRETSYASSDACRSCHADIYDSHLHTRHFLTSQPATEELIKGSFREGENIFQYGRRAYIAMEKRDSGLFQVGYENGKETKARHFDIVMGSGTKGQTYVYWMGNRPLQLPVSYFTSVDQWTNSPGFPRRIVFNRAITSRCLECHSTFAETISPPGKEPEEFDRASIIYGVDCEKCHGPAADHVKYQQANPADTVAQYILNPASFTRQQKLDLCALCHGGRISKTQASFSFRPGDKLSDFFVFDTVGRNAADIDVHGNQYGLLAASKCFTMSQMTCESCHSPHENERGQTAVFSMRCMNCHDNNSGHACGMTRQVGSVIERNCIDCHMPQQLSRAIAFMLQGSSTPKPALMRTHLIKPYPGETPKVLAEIRALMKEKTPSR